MIYGWTCILGNSENSWWFVTGKCSDLDTKPKVKSGTFNISSFIFTSTVIHAYVYLANIHKTDFTMWAYKHNN